MLELSHTEGAESSNIIQVQLTAIRSIKFFSRNATILVYQCYECFFIYSQHMLLVTTLTVLAEDNLKIWGYNEK